MTTLQSSIPELDNTNQFTTRGAQPTEILTVHTKKIFELTPLTKENFAPFGVILNTENRIRLPINTYGDKLGLYREDFSSDQPIEWFIANFKNRGQSILFMERHQQITQTFIPLGGKEFYLFLAPPNCSEHHGFPDLDQIKVFKIPGNTAVQLHRATWHENPLVLEDNTQLLVTSHTNLTLAHQQSADPALKDLPLDLERRWFKHGGYEISFNK
jgi:ureidoglycolate lyase